MSAPSLAVAGAFGDAVASPVTGYTLVYAVEIVLLLATLVAVGPLVRPRGERRDELPSHLGPAVAAGLQSGGLGS